MRYLSFILFFLIGNIVLLHAQNKGKDQPDVISIDEKLDKTNVIMLENEATIYAQLEALKAENIELKARLQAVEEKLKLLLSTNETISSATADERAEAKPKTTNPPLNTGPKMYASPLLGPIEAKYYIIVGSYTKLAHAENRIAELNQLGYTPVIVKDPRSDNVHRIVIDTADDYEKAQQLLSAYKKLLDPNAWIIMHQD